MQTTTTETKNAAGIPVWDQPALATWFADAVVGTVIGLPDNTNDATKIDSVIWKSGPHKISGEDFSHKIVGNFATTSKVNLYVKVSPILGMVNGKETPLLTTGKAFEDFYSHTVFEKIKSAFYGTPQSINPAYQSFPAGNGYEDNITILAKPAAREAIQDAVDLITASKAKGASNLTSSEKAKATKMVGRLKELLRLCEMAESLLKGDLPEKGVDQDFVWGQTSTWKFDMSYVNAHLSKKYAEVEFSKSAKDFGFDIFNGTLGEYSKYLVSLGYEWAAHLNDSTYARKLALHYAGAPGHQLPQNYVHSYSHYAHSQMQLKKAMDALKAANGEFTPLVGEKFPEKPSFLESSNTWLMLTYALSTDSQYEPCSTGDSSSVWKPSKVFDYLVGTLPDGVGQTIYSVLDAYDEYGENEDPWPVIFYFFKNQVWGDRACFEVTSEFAVPLLPGMEVHASNSYFMFIPRGKKDAEGRNRFAVVNRSSGELHYDTYSAHTYKWKYTAPFQVSYADALGDGKSFSEDLWKAVEESEKNPAVENTEFSGNDYVALKSALAPHFLQPSDMSTPAKNLILLNASFTEIVVYKNSVGHYLKPGQDTLPEVEVGINSDLFQISGLYLGGGRPKKYYADRNGETYFAKYDNENKFRPDTEQAATDIARLFGYNVPESAVRTLGGDYAYVQHIVPAERDLYYATPQKLGFDSQAVLDIMLQHPLDWVISNHDNHGGNMMVASDERVLKIDLGQAWKFLGEDKLEIGWVPQGNFDPVWYDRYYNALLVHEIEESSLNHVIGKVLSRAWRISRAHDDIYRTYLESAFANRSFYPVGMDRDSFIDLAMKRKADTFSDFFKFYEGLYSKAGYAFKWSIDGFGKYQLPENDAHLVPNDRFAEEVKKGGTHGKSLFFAGSEIEDAHALFYTMKNSKPAGDILIGDLKLHHRHFTKGDPVEAWVKSQGTTIVESVVAPPPVKKPNPAAKNVMPMGDEVTSALVAFAKTVSFHCGDKAYNKETLQAALNWRTTLNTMLSELGQKFSESPDYVDRSWFQTGHQQFAWCMWAADMLIHFDSVTKAMSEGVKSPKVPTKATYIAPSGVDTSPTPTEVEMVTHSDLTYIKWSDFNYTSKWGPISPEQYDKTRLKGEVEDLTAKPEEKPSPPKPKAKNVYSVKSKLWSTPKHSGVDDEGVAYLTSEQTFDKMVAYYITTANDPDISIQYAPLSNFGKGDKTNPGRIQIRVENWDGTESAIEKVLDILREMGLELAPADSESMELFYWQHLSNIVLSRGEDGGKWYELKSALYKMGEDTPLYKYKEVWAKAIGWNVLNKADWMPHFGKTRAHMPGEGDIFYGRPHWIRPDYDYAAIHKMNGGSLPSRHEGYGLEYLRGGVYAANEDKIRFRGWFGEGTGANSPTSDRGHGSSQYAYVRQGNDVGYYSNGFYVEPHVMLWTHNYAYGQDRYGNIDLRQTECRYEITRSIQCGLSGIGIGKGGGSNELLIKYGLSFLDDIAVVVFDSEALRKEFLKFYKDRGITELRGISLSERFVHTEPEAKKTIAKIWKQAIDGSK